MKTKRLIFADGLIGYMQSPEGVTQEVVVEGNPIIAQEEIQATDEQLTKLIDESKDKRVAMDKGKPKKNKEGHFIIEDVAK